LEPKRASDAGNPSPRERERAALVAAIRNAAMQMEQTLRAVENSVDLLWRTNRSGRG
jgi:hypothetical protein